jgi:acyl carrier protein
MDFLNFVIAIHDATEIEIPEDDYAELMTLNECIAYLEARQAT